MNLPLKGPKAWKNPLVKDLGRYTRSLFLYYIVMILCLIIWQVFRKYLLGLGWIPFLGDIYADASNYLMSILIGFFIFKRIGRRPLRTYFIPRKQNMTLKRFLLYLVLITLITYLCDPVFSGVNHLAQSFGYTLKMAPNLGDPRISGTEILYSCLLAPLSEEIIFRGVLMQDLSKYGEGLALIFSALMFALFHADPVMTPITFMAGLLLAYIALEHSLAWSLLFHLLNNWKVEWVDLGGPSWLVDFNLLIFIICLAILLMICWWIESSRQTDYDLDWSSGNQMIQLVYSPSFWIYLLAIIFLLMPGHFQPLS